MHVRIKITLLFTVIMFLLLSLLCGYIYYSSYTIRLENSKAQLTNWALTTSHKLNQPDVYNQKFMKKIDSIPILFIKNKTVQAYNYLNKRIYTYSDNAADTIQITNEVLDKSRLDNIAYFNAGRRDAVVYYDKNDRIVILAAAYDEQGKKNLRHIKFILYLSLIVGILIAFISGYFFSKILLRPVRKIADELNTISAQSLAHRIKTGNANDEWNYLTETLNDLLNRLQESFVIQRRFISAASHELSTPLTSISSQLEVSLQKDRATEEYRLVMQSVYQDVRDLSKLTQTLLEFATMSGNTGGIELNLIRIDEVLMRLPGEMTKMDKGYLVKLEFDQLPDDEERLLVFGNAELLFTAIKNIVSNACKYSINRLAKVKLSVDQSIIIVSVEDEGKGIPENELQNIFQPFYRTEDSRSIVGFGMGLPLVNRIIKLHKGHIKVNSVVGKGTTFNIQLPIAGNTRLK
jgi:two-component system sensor histidine kinase ArlS